MFCYRLLSPRADQPDLLWPHQTLFERVPERVGILRADSRWFSLGGTLTLTGTHTVLEVAADEWFDHLYRRLRALLSAKQTVRFWEQKKRAKTTEQRNSTAIRFLTPDIQNRLNLAIEAGISAREMYLLKTAGIGNGHARDCSADGRPHEFLAWLSKRRASGITLRETAQALGVSHAALSQLKSGKAKSPSLWLALTIEHLSKSDGLGIVVSVYDWPLTKNTRSSSLM